MPRFDVYRNPNPRASHGLFVVVQSDLVSMATRWCLPLLPVDDNTPVLTRAQHRLTVAGSTWLLDTPNMLAVPTQFLRKPVGRLQADEQLLVESAIDFMLRGY